MTGRIYRVRVVPLCKQLGDMSSTREPSVLSALIVNEIDHVFNDVGPQSFKNYKRNILVRFTDQLAYYHITKTQISYAVTAKLICAFVFATRIVQFLLYLTPKFQASSSFL